MERLLIVNADDFGLSKGQNYGILDACKNGLVTSTTALVNGAAIDHAGVSAAARLNWPLACTLC